jgi:hypothetical protein
MYFETVDWGNVDADLEQLTMDLGSAPERILKTHSSDKVAHLFADPRSPPRGRDFHRQ